MWLELVREVLVWPGRWVEAWINAVQTASILDIAVLAAVTAGSALLSYVVDDEIGMRLAGKPRAVPVGVKSLVTGLGPVILFTMLPAALLPWISPTTRIVVLLAWPATILWSILLLPLYIATGEITCRVHGCLAEDVDLGDILVVDAILLAVAAALARYFPGVPGYVAAGYVALSAVLQAPVHVRKEREETGGA